MKIITLDKTKELLGITDTSMDVLINRYIPIIDSKVKQITKNKYNMQITGNVTIDSKIVNISGLNNATGGIQNNFTLDDVMDYLLHGDLVEGNNIPEGSYIDDINPLEGTITLSEDVTATEANTIITVGVNIALQVTIAKGLYWLILQENTDMPDTGWTSQRIGSISVVRGVAQAAIDGRYGMPQWFVNALPRFMSAN